MRTYRKAVCTVIAVVGLASVTVGAEQHLLSAAAATTEAPVPAPVPSRSGPPPATGTEKPGATAPIPEPTVAKVQKWVKIYSGASAENIKAPTSTRGSHQVELNATPSDQIGTYVADGAGRTLYRFDNDSAKPPKSTCNGDCAKTWPPLLIKSPGEIYPKGIDPKILGYVERADGHCQVTINGWPVYYYAGDAKPGDFRGQGIKGTWFAVTPTGGKTHYLLDTPPAGGGQGY